MRILESIVQSSKGLGTYYKEFIGSSILHHTELLVSFPDHIPEDTGMRVRSDPMELQTISKRQFDYYHTAQLVYAH